MRLSGYRANLMALRKRAPEIALYRLLFRLVVWKACRIAGANPVVRLHTRSRMRLRATPHEHGIPTAIFLFHEAYEPSVRAAIDRFVCNGALCYDIGANLGLWALRMAELAGNNGQVFAFEPLSRNARGLSENAALSGLANIQVMPFALGGAQGHSTLYVPEDAGRSALAPESAADATEHVLVRTLDDVWEEQGRPPVSFVKMDVEGAEPMVLRGGHAYFGSVRPVTCCEVNPGKLRNLGFDRRDVFDAFSSWHYRALAWSHEAGDLVAFRPPEDPECTQDLVFVPEELAPELGLRC